METRIGFGYDSHVFKPGVPLHLGGLKLEHPLGLAGHSDGDVLLHAVTDALLGAVAAGDIGNFFSPSDPRWKDADSAIFVKLALEELEFHTAELILLGTYPRSPFRETLKARNGGAEEAPRVRSA